MKKKNGSKMTTAVLSVLFAAVLVVVDQWTKYLAVLHLKGNAPLELISGVLELRYLENRGAAFSILQDHQLFFYILTVIFLLAAVWVICRIPRSRFFLPVRICLIVLASGAVGNLIDRVVQKYVVDFIYFSIIDFPVFNVADIYVTLSVIALILLVLFRYKEKDFAFLGKKPAVVPEKEQQ